MTEATKKDYKDSINLPKTTLEMRANATVKEIATQKFWEENNIYEKMLERRDKSNSFVLHDGPPYLSSDKIHVGTALNKILKDIINKYKTQQGYYVPYVPGYDAHGLPIENAVVKNSIILTGTKIEDCAIIENAVIDKYVVVSANVSVKGPKSNPTYIRQGKVVK